MAKNKAKTPVISQHAMVDGLSVNSVLLAINLVPVKVEDSELVPSEAKQLIKNYALGKMDRKVTAVYNSSTGMTFTIPQDMIAALGSTEKVYSLGNCGLFSAVLTAYNNHWKLRTSPDDWWFCVIKRVASAIDKNAKKESVRKMFVDHEGKQTIEVQVPDDQSIYTVDYSWFFDQMAKGIQDNVKVPEFLNGMTADFSTTTAVQKIVSQITTMYSVQEYFLYSMLGGCGIPAMEMLGTEDDWKKLKSKLKVLRTLLEPIENDLDLPSEWWDVVEQVFSKLLATYQGKPDRKWWSHVITYESAYGSGMDIDGKYAYRGWITEFLEGAKGRFDISQMTSGLVSLPLQLRKPPGVDINHMDGVTDTAKLVAGMPGFTIHTDNTSDSVSVQPFQGWSLLLSADSPFRE